MSYQNTMYAYYLLGWFCFFCTNVALLWVFYPKNTAAVCTIPLVAIALVTVPMPLSISQKMIIINKTILRISVMEYKDRCMVKCFLLIRSDRIASLSSGYSAYLSSQTSYRSRRSVLKYDLRCNLPALASSQLS